MKSKDLLSLMVPGQVRLELTPSQPPHSPRPSKAGGEGSPGLRVLRASGILALGQKVCSWLPLVASLE